MSQFKFKIRITEHERGWGQRSEFQEFDTYEEAVGAISQINSKNTASVAPNWYETAEPENFKLNKP